MAPVLEQNSSGFPQRTFNLSPPQPPSLPVRPIFPPVEFLHKNHHNIPTKGLQQTPPSPEGYRSLPLSPASSISSGPVTPPSPRSPKGRSLSSSSIPIPQQQKQQHPHGYPCPQRRRRKNRQPTENTRPSLAGSILREMGIHASSLAQSPTHSSASSLNSIGSSSPMPSDSGSLSGNEIFNIKTEDHLDVAKVQKVYVNYLRQLLRNIEDCKAKVDNSTNKNRITPHSDAKQFRDLNTGNIESTTSCCTSSSNTSISKLEQKCQDLRQQAKKSASDCQSDDPIIVKVVHKKDLNRSTELDTPPVSSDVMAILQAEILRKSLRLSEDDVRSDEEEKNSSKSGMDFIHGLIEDEYHEMKLSKIISA